MSQPNTLFILAKMGLKDTDKSGIFESHMWRLDGHEESMEYVSLHKSKADRAYIGGRIIEVRLAIDSEIKEHQDLMVKNGKGPMKVTDGRKVVVFRLEPKWNAPWPNPATPNRMMYKCIGYIAWNNAGDRYPFPAPKGRFYQNSSNQAIFISACYQGRTEFSVGTGYG